MTPHNYEIADCGAFCDVIFSASRPRICFGTFSTVSPEILNIERWDKYEDYVHNFCETKELEPILTLCIIPTSLNFLEIPYMESYTFIEGRCHI
jgi:hypothetical protein